MKSLGARTVKAEGTASINPKMGTSLVCLGTEEIARIDRKDEGGKELGCGEVGSRGRTNRQSGSV